MKIPRELPQFNTEVALIMAISKQGATFLKANKGVIEEIAKVSIEKPSYSDREGFFQRSGKGKVFGSGAVEEIRDEEIEQDLIRELKKPINDLYHDKTIDKIYLFIPSYFISKFKEKLPNKLKEKIEMEFQKNVENFHPTEILKSINQVNEQKIKEMKNVPQSEEEGKILKKNEPDREYI